MAAGLGFKTFTTGEVLTAADTNGYLMQGVLVFASSAARAAAITSPQEGQYSYLKDTNSTEYYDGAAWIAAPIGDITGVTAGTGISGGGTSGTVTITNDMATTITAAGDIVIGTGSGTYDNLPIGTTAQVLTADTTVSPYKVKWATASSGAMTLIKRASFSNVATTTTTFDSVFTSTYKVYQIVFENMYSSVGSQFGTIAWRGSGSTQGGTNWYGVSVRTTQVPATASTASDGLASFKIMNLDNGSSTGGSATMFAYDVGTGSGSYGRVWGNATTWPGAIYFGAGNNASFTCDGFILSATSGNIYGTVSVYGLAIA